MSHEKHLKLIDQLSNELSPVDVHWSPEKRFLFWLTIHFTWITAFMFFSGPFRTKGLDEFKNLSLIFESTLFILSLGTTGYFAYLSLVPGALHRKFFKLSLLPVMILIGLLFFSS